MMRMYLKYSVIILFFINKVSAQTVNVGELSVAPNTQLATVFDFDNKPSGDFLNDGNFYVYSNFKNDGLVTFTDTSDGKTFFIGQKVQLIEGLETAHFQNIEFNNLSDITPFHLKTFIMVNKTTAFKNGIVDGASFNGKMIFDKNAFHSDASNLSFVDGQVENIGNLNFEFPVGDNFYFRPTYHDKASNISNVYTTQYFFKSAGSTHPYTSKEQTLLSIDEVEYWNLTQNQGSEKIILSLTLDKNTTPASFFGEDPTKELAITRWDETTSKWINEKGVTTDLLTGATYSKLITTQVSGYGLFTIAMVKKANPEPPGDLIIHNAISPNGDGVNDSFLIKGISKYPDNRVEIYNRWGIKVFDATSYNESDIMFRGFSDGRSTVNRDAGLPAGTYFYILRYKKGDETISKSGYLYIGSDK
ncbi:gliding motility-associated C-terminal domain-containing protein [Flavobacterium sp. LC2016-12]|uniref:gliding motility-associated C-terminal domain-containing protein n=1 Tax=Flavobacterium sp. LC2016-12 TaxID=2783794 RepID=UPI00188BE4F7|nr:gliding motility-associated C-terminal domain-containing protein [Flavobacterium sp. LC2016-12]MBF4465214.1 gliding motility-associated C-terminal domain-containing protein [Flavobacterium sp. LC2016-12]